MIYRKKLGYIANKSAEKTEKNFRGVEVKKYDTPKSFRERYMPLTDDELKLEGYGEDVKRVLRMYVSYNEWYGKIHTGDRAYLIDENMTESMVKQYAESDNENCLNANYQVTVCAVQNFKIKIEFQKISEGK